MAKLLNPRERDSIIITLEGGEGSGKTTVDKKIRERLSGLGLKVMPQLKEPGSTPLAELIRIVLKNTIDTSYSLPPLVRTGFDLEAFSEQVSRDHLQNYARDNVSLVMGQLSPIDIKYGILEYVLNRGFEGLPHDTYCRSSIKALMHRRGDSTKHLNSLCKLVERMVIDSGCEENLASGVLSFLGKEKLSSDHQAKLFLAARNLLYHNVIGPSMHKKYSVSHNVYDVDGSLGEFDVLINDRSCDSTVVYQGYAQDPSKVGRLREENILAMEGILPDLTLYLDVSPEVGIARTRGGRGMVGKDFFDSLDMSFHRKVREGYKSESAFYKRKTDFQYNRIVEVDASGSKEEVAKNVLGVIEERLGEKIKKVREIRSRV